MGRLVFAVAGLSCTIAACSLFVSTSGLSSGSDGAGGDAEAGVLDGSGLDTSSAVPFAGASVAFADTRGVRLRTASNDGTWTAPVEIAAPAAPVRYVAHARHPRGEGDVVIVQEVSNGGAKVTAHVRQPGGGFVKSFEQAGNVDRAHQRTVAAAYESLTGNLMVVYADNTGAPKYRTMKGGVWSAPGTVTPRFQGALPPAVMTLAARPKSNEIAFLCSDAGSNLFVTIWDGSTWGPDQDLDADVTTTDWQSVAATYTKNGTLVLVWSSHSATESGLFAAIKPPDGARGPRTPLHPNYPPGPIAIAADRDSDRVAVVYAEYDVDGCSGTDCDLLVAGIYDGARWAPFKNIQALGAGFTGRRGASPIAVTWLSGAAIAVTYRPNEGLEWLRWTVSSDWTVQPVASLPPITGAKPSIQLLSNGTDVLAFVSDTSANLWAKRFDGARWSDADGRTPLTSDLPTPSGMPFGGTR